MMVPIVSFCTLVHYVSSTTCTACYPVVFVASWDAWYSWWVTMKWSLKRSHVFLLCLFAPTLWHIWQTGIFLEIIHRDMEKIWSDVYGVMDLSFISTKISIFLSTFLISRLASIGFLDLCFLIGWNMLSRCIYCRGVWNFQSCALFIPHDRFAEIPERRPVSNTEYEFDKCGGRVLSQQENLGCFAKVMIHLIDLYSHGSQC